MSRALRILHVSTETGWRGGEQQVKLLTDGLVARGHDCHVLSPADAALYRDRRASPGVHVHALRHHGEWDLLAARRLAQLVRDEKIEMVHAHTSHAHSLAWLAARWIPQVPIIVSRRVDFRVGGNWVSRRKYLSERVHFIAISNAIRDILQSSGVPQSRLFVVHSGVALDRYQFRAGERDEEQAQRCGAPRGVPLILNVAALTDHKDQATLLRAAAILKQELPLFRLVIAGSGELEHELRALCATLGLDELVNFAGYITELAPLYAAADVFVMSSHMEGLCTSILDAMVAGVPVVATRAGGIPEIVQHERNGLLAPPRNPEELAAALMLMLNHHELRRKCVEQGRRIVETEFSNNSMVEGTLRVYESLLQRTGSR